MTLFLSKNLRDVELIILNYLFPYFIKKDNSNKININNEINILKKISIINKTCNNYVHSLIGEFYEYFKEYKNNIIKDLGKIMFKFDNIDLFQYYIDYKYKYLQEFYERDIFIYYCRLYTNENKKLNLIKYLLDMILQKYIKNDIEELHYIFLNQICDFSIEFNLLEHIPEFSFENIKSYLELIKLIDKAIIKNNLQVIKLIVKQNLIIYSIHPFIRYCIIRKLCSKITIDYIVNRLDKFDLCEMDYKRLYKLIPINNFDMIRYISDKIKESRSLTLNEKTKYKISLLKYKLFY